MKVTLWATLSANGNYARATPDNPARAEALADFRQRALENGNFIVGRKTFEESAARGPNPDFRDADIVVVSRSGSGNEGLLSATSPRAALELLASRGHTKALISGGETLHNAFLADGLIDEVILNIAPVLEGGGLSIHLPPGTHRPIEFISCSEIGGGLVQLRYALRSDSTAQAP
jgi:dihydrofolate reductase